MGKKENYSVINYFPIGKINYDYNNVKANNYMFLLDLCSSIFKWNFEDISYKDNVILSAELEKILMLNGVATIADVGKNNVEIKAFFCEENTPTYYYDVFKKRTIYSPLVSKMLDDSTSVLVWNNQTKTPCNGVISNYAEQLTHIDLSIRNVAINMREPLNIPTAGTNKMLAILKSYRDKIFKGEYEPIQDSGLVQCEFVKGERYESNILPNLLDSRKKLLLDFYNTFGIRTGIEKKGNVIEDEIVSSEPMLQINIDDMLRLRELACKEIYELWGIKATVEKSVNNMRGVQDGVKQGEIK